MAGDNDEQDPSADTAMFQAFVDEEQDEDQRAGNNGKALLGVVLLVVLLAVGYFAFLR